MSVQVFDKIIYYKIGKTLKLNYDFLNRIYEANQNAYDSSYNLDQEIESLNQSDYNQINFDKIDSSSLSNLLLQIKYNLYPNDSDTILNKSDLEKLDLLIYISKVNKQTSEDLI